MMTLLEQPAIVRLTSICTRAGVLQIEKGVPWTVQHPLAPVFWPGIPIERSVG